MTKPLLLLAGVVLVASVLAAAAPAVIRLAAALVPLVVAVGCVIALLRIVWHFTSRY